MMWLLEGLSLVVTLVLIPPFLVLGLTTLAAIWGRGRGGPPPEFRNPDAPRIAFVIPAHDEEPGIAATVASCSEVDYPSERRAVFVIADNCSDQTAQVARNAGATVFERFDPVPDRKTKGHALETFFRHAPGWGSTPDYDAAVIVDADTVVDPLVLRHFGQSFQRGEDWLQGFYGVRNPDASWRTRLLTLAFALRNGVTPLGQDRLGLSVGLQGNGMGFSTRGLRRVPWQAYGLVEDMEFALLLRSRGERVRFLPEARVFGEMVSRGGPAAAAQRQRWEAGRRSLRRKFLPVLLRSTAIGPARKLFYAIDLATPPLSALLVGLSLGVIGVGISTLDPTNSGRSLRLALLTTQLLMIASLLVYTLSPVVALRLPPRYLKGLAMLPLYLAWKLVASAGRTPGRWVRTARESSRSSSS